MKGDMPFIVGYEYQMYNFIMRQTLTRRQFVQKFT